MKSVFVSIVLVLSALQASAAMSRVVSVENHVTIVVETKGVTSTVSLRNVALATEDRAAATRYLRTIISNAWVYIENGDVYRSPDGLHVNDALRRRAWIGATDLGALYERASSGTSVVVIGAEANKVNAPELSKSPSKKRRARRR